jgi:tetratricopeptide (TPR) repeat protein
MKVNIHADSRNTAIVRWSVGEVLHIEVLHIEVRPMKTSLKIAGLSLKIATKIATKIALCAFLLLFLAGCNRIARVFYRSSYDRDISSATKAIESASDNPHRAEAYAKRGSAYSEKARYSKAFKLISADEYDRLFGLAIKDHDQAIALDPSAEAYYTRGVTNYDRAALEAVVDGNLVGSEADRKAWFEPATADFRKAIEKDSRLYLAWDRLGLSHETIGELDQAISDYTQEMALNPLGRARLADAYCTRGGSTSPKEKQHDDAIADFEKSIDLGATADDCSCDPYNPLLALYTEGRQYDLAWGVVHKVQKSKKWIAPESLDRLKKESGRSN